jgi:hypothetical protein
MTTTAIETRTAEILNALEALRPYVGTLVDTLTEDMLPAPLKDCAIATPESIQNALYASGRRLPLEKIARFFATIYTLTDITAFTEAYDAAAPEVYNQDDDIMTGTPWCMPWMTGAMGAEKGDTPESLGRKAACMDYGELEALFGPDEEGLAARTEAAVRGFLLDGIAIPGFLKPEESVLDKAAAEIAEAQERGLEDEEAERLISEIVTGCIRDITPRVAMRKSR